MEPLPSWKTFFAELLLYAALVAGYFALVLRFLGGWLEDLFNHHRVLFAVMALVVMIGQAVGLEIISSLLMWLFHRKGK